MCDIDQKGDFILKLSHKTITANRSHYIP